MHANGCASSKKWIYKQNYHQGYIPISRIILHAYMIIIPVVKIYVKETELCQSYTSYELNLSVKIYKYGYSKSPCVDIIFKLAKLDGLI